ncbi:alcohol dehydrogenase catalytic domain-containing protein [Streptomyces sp. NPDC086077]|uniref:alcohol dehydrogenase catalytic domain-containing protein n=1 Tax=Streptomyces sp. NPDC086077 TaxID=3154862 RepID=UPI003418D44B
MAGAETVAAAALTGKRGRVMTVVDKTMRAWSVTAPGPVEAGGLRLVDRPVPAPGEDELLVRVRACGVCRADLHVTEGELPVHRPGGVPGHVVAGDGAGCAAS